MQDSTECKRPTMITDVLKNARCYICHQCRPSVQQYKFTGHHSREEFFYLLWTCRTPVEHSRAMEEINDEEGNFDPSRFFANRIVGTDPVHAVVNGYDNDRGGEGPETEEPKTSLTPATTRIGVQRPTWNPSPQKPLHIWTNAP